MTALSGQWSLNVNQHSQSVLDAEGCRGMQRDWGIAGHARIAAKRGIGHSPHYQSPHARACAKKGACKCTAGEARLTGPGSRAGLPFHGTTGDYLGC